MISLSASLGAERLVVSCAPRLRSQAKWLLDFLQRLYQEQGVVHDGSNIQFGWTVLLVRRVNGDLVVHAPDYEHDPFRDITPDLTLSLDVQMRQNETLRRLGLEGQVASFQDKVVAARGVLLRRRVYLERAKGAPDGDSGWYVGPVEGRNASCELELEAYYVFQLLKARPSLLKVLALPPGYLVVFSEDRIEAVLDSADVDVWAASARDTR